MASHSAAGAAWNTSHLSPPAGRHHGVGIVHLVSVNAGQDFTLWAPYEDGSVTGSCHDKLSWRKKTKIRRRPRPNAATDLSKA